MTAVMYCEDGNEFRYLRSTAMQLGYLSQPNRTATEFLLTLQGWTRLNEIGKGSGSRQAFVAMWFDPSLDDAWENGFKMALSDCSYDPQRIDLQEHNQKICDRIVAEIRKSGLVVADFTGQRGGVYFEAGFAMGLNKPLIWTCRKDSVDRLHFDTRQYNHIVWETPAELRIKLTNRVDATFPRR